MKKILPLNLNVGVTTECWTLYRLAAILNDPKYYPWYYEKFINLTMIDNCEVIYYPTYYADYKYRFLENQYIYDEVLDFINIEFTKRNIVDMIIDGINKGWYSLLDYNRYFIEGDKRYLKKDNYHDVVICGYDLNKEIFYCFDYNLRNIQIAVQTIKFQQLEEAFLSSIKYHKEIGEYSQYCENLPASYICLNEYFEREICLGRILDTLENFMNSYTIEITAEEKVYSIKKGISIYKGYSQDLYERLLNDKNYFSNNILTLFRMKTVLESKKGMFKRMSYLKANKYVVFDENELWEKSDNLIKKIENAFLCMTKFHYTHKKELLSKSRDLWNQIQVLDEDFTGKCINIIKGSIF